LVVRGIAVEGVEVGLVDEIGFSGSLVVESGEEPGESLAYVADVQIVFASIEFAAQCGDRVADIAVLGAQTVDAVAQAWLRARDVGEETVGLVGVGQFFAGGVVENFERFRDVELPGTLTVESRLAERPLELVHGREGAVIVSGPLVQPSLVRGTGRRIFRAQVVVRGSPAGEVGVMCWRHRELASGGTRFRT